MKHKSLNFNQSEAFSYLCKFCNYIHKKQSLKIYWLHIKLLHISLIPKYEANNNKKKSLPVKKINKL